MVAPMKPAARGVTEFRAFLAASFLPPSMRIDINMATRMNPSEKNMTANVTVLRVQALKLAGLKSEVAMIYY